MLRVDEADPSEGQGAELGEGRGARARLIRSEGPDFERQGARECLLFNPLKCILNI